MKQSNILFVLTDDQGEWAMGCAGNKDIQTPTLDKLAEKGTRFNNFYCASPVCSPARASLLTGKTPSAHGIQDWISQGNLDAWKYPEMDNIPSFDKNDKAINYLEDNQTYMGILSDNGYVCSLSGK